MRREDKTQKLLAKYGLDDLTFEEDADTVTTIATELAGTGLMEAGMKMSLTMKSEELCKISYLRAIMEQNWIMIRQLDRIATLLAYPDNE